MGDLAPSCIHTARLVCSNRRMHASVMHSSLTEVRLLVRADCMIADFDGERIVDVWTGVYASFVGCTFDGITLYEHAGLGGEAILGVSAVSLQFSHDVWRESTRDTFLRPEGCKFDGDAMPALVGQDYGMNVVELYADAQSASATECLTFTNTRGCKGGAKPLDEAVPGFLNSSSPWLSTTMEVPTTAFAAAEHSGACCSIVLGRFLYAAKVWVQSG